MNLVVPAVGARVKTLRLNEGMSVVALAQASGVARATLTQLEAGRGNPTLETLYSLANALRVPLSAVLPLAEPLTTTVIRSGTGVRVAGSVLNATLLAHVSEGRLQIDMYDMTIAAGEQHTSSAHGPGTVEHVHVHAGILQIGPSAEPVELRSGDYARFDGAVEHLYNAVEQECRVTLVIVTDSAESTL